LVFIIIAFGGIMAPAAVITAVLSQWLFKTAYEVLGDTTYVSGGEPTETS
jgi:hypothetical protein